PGHAGRANAGPVYFLQAFLEQGDAKWLWWVVGPGRRRGAWRDHARPRRSASRPRIGRRFGPGPSDPGPGPGGSIARAGPEPCPGPVRVGRAFLPDADPIGSEWGQGSRPTRAGPDRGRRTHDGPHAARLSAPAGIGPGGIAAGRAGRGRVGAGRGDRLV